MLHRLIAKCSRFVDRETAPPDMMSDLRRNMDLLVLGGTRVWEASRFRLHSELDNSRVMLAARPLRSTAGDWMILRHMHSYLRKGGTVLFPIDLVDRTYRASGYDYGEIRMFHPVVNESLGLQWERKDCSRCFIHYPWYGLVLLLSFLAHKLGITGPSGSIWSKRKINSEQFHDIITRATPILMDAHRFCLDRGLRFAPILIMPKHHPEKTMDFLAVRSAIRTCEVQISHSEDIGEILGNAIQSSQKDR